MFTQKKFEISFRIMLIIVGIFAISTAPLLGLPILGGVISQGILGGFSGKVGPVVGGKWKDIDYMRGYVTPANPNTAGQQTVRAKFSALVAVYRQILSTIIQPYWDMFYTNMSGCNAWIKENYALASSAGVIDENAIMSKGTLQATDGLVFTYNAGTGAADLSWRDNTGEGNALGTDSVGVVVLNPSQQKLTTHFEAVTRTSGTVSLTLSVGLDDPGLIAYLFFFRGTGSEMIVSDSVGVVGL